MLCFFLLSGRKQRIRHARSHDSAWWSQEFRKSEREGNRQATLSHRDGAIPWQTRTFQKGKNQIIMSGAHTGRRPSNFLSSHCIWQVFRALSIHFLWKYAELRDITLHRRPLDHALGHSSVSFNALKCSGQFSLDTQLGWQVINWV